MALACADPARGEFRGQFRVLDNECDLNGNLTCGGLMRICQQIASDSCTPLGLTPGYYQRTHTAWVMTNSALEIARVPRWGEELTVITRPQNIKRAIFKRIVEIYDADGNELAALDGRWVLLDTQKGTILRHLPENYLELGYPDEVPRELNQKIPRISDTEPVCTMRATYSLCDTNRHLNNTHYADIVCDALPDGLLETQRVARLAIAFKHEVPYGAVFTVSRAKLEDGTWYVAGESADENGKAKQHFQAAVSLAPLAF